jgi:hypothetical protein
VDFVWSGGAAKLKCANCGGLLGWIEHPEVGLEMKDYSIETLEDLK